MQVEGRELRDSVNWGKTDTRSDPGWGVNKGRSSQSKFLLMCVGSRLDSGHPRRGLGLPQVQETQGKGSGLPYTSPRKQVLLLSVCS